MEIKSNEELMEDIGEAFLWTIIGDYVEHDFVQIKEALRKIGYIEQDMVEQIAWAKYKHLIVLMLLVLMLKKECFEYLLKCRHLL